MSSAGTAERQVTCSKWPHKSFFGIKGDGGDRSGLKPGCVAVSHGSAQI